MCFYLNALKVWFLGRGQDLESKEKKFDREKESQEALNNNKNFKFISNTVLDNKTPTKYESNLLMVQENKDSILTKQQIYITNKYSNNLNHIMSANNNLPSSQPEQTSNNAPQSQANDSCPQSTQSQETSQFKIRTQNRRHLDFEPEFDLNDLNAKSNTTKWKGPFHFIQAADSQLGMIDSYIHKKTEPGWSEEIKLCEILVAKCNQMEPKPKFMIICGDLVDAWRETEIRRQQVADFKRIFAKLSQNIPLVCVCGNHDVGDEPTIDGVLEYRRTFGDDYFYYTLNDVLFIVINSQFYQHRENVQDYAKQQDQWLESLLAKCKLFKYSIVFEHIPWFLEHYDEEDDYFNIKKQVRLIWLRKFKDAGVTKIMCGHYHRNAGGWFEDMELVVTSAIGAQCGNDKSGVRIVKVLDESIEHQYYAMQDIPSKVEL